MTRSSSANTPEKRRRKKKEESNARDGMHTKRENGNDRRKGRKKPEKTEKLDFVQDFLPVKEIENGIIETTDGRYVHIVEITPVNFTLQDPSEQVNTLTAFASWLKVCPTRVQFKTVTRPANSNKHISQIKEEQQSEPNEKVRELADDYIHMVTEVGRREALTRRFFIIIEYEQLGYSRGTYTEIYNMIYSTVGTIKKFLGNCGNSIVELRDQNEQQAEILYTFFNRRSSFTEDFYSRVRRVVADAYPSKNIRKNHFIAPRGLDFSHYDHIVMDGLCYAYFYITGDGYPSKIQAGWLSSIYNFGAGVDVDLFLTKRERGKVIDDVGRHIRWNQSKMRDVQETSSDFDSLEGSISSGYYIKESIAQHNQDLFDMQILITVSASTPYELMMKTDQLKLHLKARDTTVRRCNFRMENALKSSMPLLQIDKDIEAKARRNILTSSAAALYPFTAYEMCYDSGIMLGINRQNNSLCIVDPFDTKANKNANMAIIGTSGAGKSYTMKLISERFRMRDIQCFVILPEKGHEFIRLCNAIGGQYIQISAGSRDCINIMEIRNITSPNTELLDGISFEETDSLLARKIQQLMIFIELLDPEISNSEASLVDAAITAVYARFGITADNNTIYVDPDADVKVLKRMPVLGDLYDELKKNRETSRVAMLLNRFVSGSAQAFNRPTNVDLTNKYLVFDLSKSTGTMLPVAMMIVLDYVWDSIKADRTMKKAVFIDEVWRMIGENRQAAEFVLEIFKIIRGYGGAAITATQELSDFFALEDGKYGRGIINNCKTKIVLNLEPDEAKVAGQTLNLTRFEKRQIIKAEVGDALLIAGQNRVNINVHASPEENNLITTDRGELARIAEREKRARAAKKSASEDASA